MNDLLEILLVDDNASDAELTLHVLSRHFAAVANSIKVVQDGVEALDYLFCTGEYSGRDPHQPPKMVLLDLHLPKLGGLEVLRLAKADPRTSAIPIVVFSSSWEDRDLRLARELGAHSYVVKPVDFGEFVEAVRAALEVANTGLKAGGNEAS